MRETIFTVMLALAPLLGVAQSLSTRDTLHASALAFDTAWDRYIRDLFGCMPGEPTVRENCSPARETVNYAAFVASCEQAKKLFHLQGDCKR